MRLLILLILFPFVCDAQIIRAHPYYKPLGSPCEKLLDSYSGAAAAYSLRLLDCQYSGSAIRVRRSSDNTEQDVGFTANGDLDTASLKTFVGTGGSDDGFVVTWYDQSGNTRNATNSTAGEQPLIMDNGAVIRKNGYAAILSDGSNDVLTYSITVNTNLLYAFASVSKESGGAGNRLIGYAENSTSNDWSTTAGFAALTIPGTTAFNYRNFSFGVTLSSLSTGTRYIFYTYINSSELGLSYNGGSVTTAATSSTSMNSSIGSIFSAPWSTTDGFGNFYTNEIVIYRADKSLDRSNIISNINTYWGVY